jgi:hypothetical protein
LINIYMKINEAGNGRWHTMAPISQSFHGGAGSGPTDCGLMACAHDCKRLSRIADRHKTH